MLSDVRQLLELTALPTPLFDVRQLLELWARLGKIDLDEQIRLHNIDGFERKKIAYWVGFPLPSCCLPFLPQLSPPSTLYSQNWLSSTTSDHHSCTSLRAGIKLWRASSPPFWRVLVEHHWFKYTA
ncbi:hypothetical protein POTOM_009404 [Populus tomentosa]|uniref:Uncharacterized protein n=1 Tax=Populus tomentosa TaxID=118781 RepID=A0A8X8A691_POPTO|nr:hypothetical protein POTOM_009404 [Populus tomentosa]